MKLFAVIFSRILNCFCVNETNQFSYSPNFHPAVSLKQNMRRIFVLSHGISFREVARSDKRPTVHVRLTRLPHVYVYPVYSHSCQEQRHADELNDSFYS